MQNMQIQNNLIDGAFNSGVEKFIFLGSSCIYPKLASQPLKEEYLLTDSLEPTNEWYAIAKISGVKACQAIRNQYGKDYVSLMPTNLYGYFDNFEDHERISENAVYNDNPIDEKLNTLGSFTDARIHLHSVSSGGTYDTQHTNPTSSYSYEPNKIKAGLLHRQPKFNELTDGISIKMSINGSTNISVGQTINVNIPVTGKVHDKEFDKYYTGKYLITKLRDKF